MFACTEGMIINKFIKNLIISYLNYYLLIQCLGD
jgi:hypothetical protein